MKMKKNITGCDGNRTHVNDYPYTTISDILGLVSLISTTPQT